MGFQLIVAEDIEAAIGAQEERTQSVGARAAIGHDLPELAGEVAKTGHLDEAVAVGGAVVENVESVASEGIGEAVPCFGVEGAIFGGDCDSFDGYIELHGGRGDRDVTH